MLVRYEPFDETSRGKFTDETCKQAHGETYMQALTVMHKSATDNNDSDEVWDTARLGQGQLLERELSTQAMWRESVQELLLKAPT